MPGEMGGPDNSTDQTDTTTSMVTVEIYVIMADANGICLARYGQQCASSDSGWRRLQPERRLSEATITVKNYADKEKFLIDYPKDKNEDVCDEFLTKEKQVAQTDIQLLKL